MDAHYPLFDQPDAYPYVVGSHRVPIRVDPTDVLPPSEATLAIAEAIVGMRARRALDIGTGSGMLAILMQRSGCEEVWGVDINPRAIKCAAANIRRNGMNAPTHLKCVDVRGWLPGERFDLIVGNAPFMPVPSGMQIISEGINWAVNGGEDGTVGLIEFECAASRLLADGGRYVFALPHFVDYEKVLQTLRGSFAVRKIAGTVMSYWPPDWEDACNSHMESLVRSGTAQVWREDGIVKSVLDILVATRLRKGDEGSPSA